MIIVVLVAIKTTTGGMCIDEGIHVTQIGLLDPQNVLCNNHIVPIYR